MNSTDQNEWRETVHTLEEARDFVLKVGVCGILHDPKGDPNLWDAIDAPDKKPDEPGWGEKMGYVWGWKNELPATYPTEIFYGKRKNGKAMLCTMALLRQFYDEQFRPLTQLSQIAQRLYTVIAQNPVNNKELRLLAGMTGKADKAAFDKALLELQIAFQIVRVNKIDTDGGTWTPFEAQYPNWSAFTPA